MNDGQIKTVLLAAAGFNREMAVTIQTDYSNDIKIGFLDKGSSTLLQNEIDVDLVRKWFDEINASNGIGEELYLAISQLTPSINVDLIVKSNDGKKPCFHGVMINITVPGGMCLEA